MFDFIFNLFESILDYFRQYPFLYKNLKFIGVFLLAGIIYFIARKVIFRVIKRVVKSTKSQLDDIFLNDRVLRRLSYIAPLIVFYEFAFIVPDFHTVIRSFSIALIILFIMLAVGAMLKGLQLAYGKHELYKNRQIKGYLQILKVVIYSWGTIFLVGHISGKDAWDLITGLGALTAVAVLIFRDSILGLVASLQISWYDLVNPGDYIEMPKYGAEGNVIDIALHTVKIKNLDNTISIVPTYKLIEDGFKNYKGINESGNRRIRRSILLNSDSIQFVDKIFNEKLAAKLNSFKFLTSPVKEKELTTNLTLFRDATVEYLKSCKDIEKEMTIIVRPLQPTSEGIPVEITAYIRKTDFLEFETLQAEIFDVIFALLNAHELKFYQKSN